MQHYKCAYCGTIFKDARKTYEPSGELLLSCPFCGFEEYEEADICLSCGSFFLENEIHNGLCRDCVMEKVSYKSLIDFMIENEWFSSFVLFELFDCDEKPNMEILDILNLRKLFLKLEFYGNHNPLFERMKKFVFEDNSGIDDYAKFLEKRGD